MEIWKTPRRGWKSKVYEHLFFHPGPKSSLPNSASAPALLPLSASPPTSATSHYNRTGHRKARYDETEINNNTATAKTTSHYTSRRQARAEARALSSNPALVQHQRSRSATVAGISRPTRKSEEEPESWPLPTPVAKHAKGRYNTVEDHYELPPRHQIPGSSEVAKMDRSGDAAMGPAYTQQAQRASRPSPAMVGNYAQIDPQTTIYQRRSSSSSTVASSVGSKDTFDAILASPNSSRTSFDSWQTLSRKPDQGWQRPTPIKQYRRRRKEGELFAELPEEVLGLILQKLKESHLKPGSSSCATCMMRDLCSVAVSVKKLLKVARVALYDDIQLVGADSQTQKKRLKINFGSRLVLLRRTLRSKPGIAALVRTLKAPAVPQGVSAELYHNLVASVIMACPNLERLVGFHQNYNFTFSRLFHALSTRENLKEMHWTLEASQTQRKKGMSNAAPMLSSGKPNFQEAPGNLLPEQSEEFRELHMNWISLEALSIHCLPGATLTPVSLLPDILADISTLKHLHLSHLPFTAFNDANLLSLPALHTLTLSHLPGVSAMGLSSFARRPSSRAIRKLTLHHIDVDSLPLIAHILTHLVSLETFAFVQSHMPILPQDEIIWLFPYLASDTVKKLHWDIPSFASTANMADSVLAKSIAAHGFPALRTLRTPSDPEGIFQSLCKPMEKIDMPSDRYRGLIAKAGTKPKSPPQTPTTPTTPRTPGSIGSKSGSGLNFPNEDQLFPSKVSSNLAQSRLDAQRRLEMAKNEPRFTFRLLAENGKMLEQKRMAGFMGEIGSPISYCVTPDPGAQDENGGLVDISDFLGDGGENLKDGRREGCNGRWNTYNHVVSDKKDRERWWHTERGRWRDVRL
ncbi:hypothetical protein GGS20DRAFT_569265 [Poronia punctata]|nr:hypothetical protein GGS20DRAFT_569265 [Poronia punctata]